jgi:hypothetical protein
MLLLFLPFARLVKLVQLNASLVNANFLLRERGIDALEIRAGSMPSVFLRSMPHIFGYIVRIK